MDGVFQQARGAQHACCPQLPGGDLWLFAYAHLEALGIGERRLDEIRHAVQALQRPRT